MNTIWSKILLWYLENGYTRTGICLHMDTCLHCGSLLHHLIGCHIWHQKYKGRILCDLKKVQNIIEGLNDIFMYLISTYLIDVFLCFQSHKLPSNSEITHVLKSHISFNTHICSNHLCPDTFTRSPGLPHGGAWSRAHCTSSWAHCTKTLTLYTRAHVHTLQQLSRNYVHRCQKPVKNRRWYGKNEWTKRESSRRKVWPHACTQDEDGQSLAGDGTFWKSRSVWKATRKRWLQLFGRRQNEQKSWGSWIQITNVCIITSTAADQ